MQRFLALIMLATLGSGCATLPRGDQPRWYHKADDGTGLANGPMALWSLPSTMAFHVLRCNAAERSLDFEDIEVEDFAGARPLRFEAGGEAWNGEERMEPPDAITVSVARLPLGHPVVTAMGSGRSFRITGAAGSFTLDAPAPVRRVIAECRERVR